ncbi:MAG: gluconate 2-dehydrogenase subunit 3 family protein, partial [Rhodobacteraceae bacterium]|nr:gluconate 2-dehydrogenase subunit 3 family protein [Paracoccaceae bacterium]
YMQGPFTPDADMNLGTQSPLTPAEIYRQGIAAFETWCSNELGAAFADLPADQQDSALQALADDDVGLEPELREFWTLLLQNTKEGYFADPRHGGNAGMQAWVYIGFPGARANFHEWAGRDEAYPLGPVDIAGERA